MPVSRLLPAFLLLGLLAVPVLSGPVPAAEVSERACLTKAEQRAAVAAKKAIPLAQAIKSLREHRKHSEVVRARLCRQGEKLVYVLTLLGRSGKVVSATVDAADGALQIGL
jgi:uncharacterized membrane protein YkoI